MENIFVEFLPPWVETGLQPAFYDKESGTVLQQTARMYARVNMLIRLFNKLSKNTKETVEDYINKFNELYTYVHDYFDNLDVQEEINNKLDDMVEAGTLQEIITEYIQANVEWTFDTVAEMKTATNLVAGSYAQTLGFHAIGDGGGAIYKISNTGTANEMNIIAVGSLFANLVSDRINLKQYGLYGDGTHDDTSMLNSILGNLTDKALVYIPKGTYLCETDINVTANDIRIYGDGQLLSTIDFNNNGSIVFNGHGVKLDNIRFTKQDKVEFDSYHNTLNNVNIDHGNLGLLLKNAYITECHNCYFTYNTIGLVCDNQAYEVVITDSIIDNNKLGVLILGTTGVRIENCTIEGNRDTSTTKGCGVAFSCSNADIVINDCWFESNGTSSDSADILSVADVYDSIFEDIYTAIHSYYPFTTYGSAGHIVITNNHHNYTQYGVVMGGYHGHYDVSNNYYKGTINKYNKPILVMSRSNDLTYNYLKAHNNLVMNTDNSAIDAQMLSGIKGSYIYTNAVITVANKPKLITTEYYDLDGEPLFVYMPFLKDLSSVTYLHQWQSGGTSYVSGTLFGNATNSYSSTSPAVYLNSDGGTPGTTDIFASTGDTTYAFIMGYGKRVVVRRDTNTPQVNQPIADGYMELRTDNLYNRSAFTYDDDCVVYALVQLNADEIKASKQCVALKPKDYYPTLLPPAL